MITYKTAFSFTCHLRVTRPGGSHAVIHCNACIRGRLKTIGQTHFILQSCVYHILLTTKKNDMLWVLQMHLIHVVHVRKEAGIVISDLAPYYPACFTDASLALLPYNMISKIVRHTFVKLFHGMCQSLEAISWVFSAFIFSFLLVQL